MTLKVQAKFSHTDDYRNQVFICSEIKQPQSYVLGKKLESKIKSMVSTFNPVWVNEDYKYVKLQFRASPHRFEPDAVYELTFKPVIKTLKGREFANLIIQTSECVHKAPEQVEIEL